VADREALSKRVRVHPPTLGCDGLHAGGKEGARVCGNRDPALDPPSRRVTAEEAREALNYHEDRKMVLAFINHAERMEQAACKARRQLCAGKRTERIMTEPMRSSDLGDNDHDGKSKKDGGTHWSCSRCGKVKFTLYDIPVGWYFTSVTTNLPGEGIKNYGSFACGRACYDALKLARIDSSQA
jgi:hypothetical protein